MIHIPIALAIQALFALFDGSFWSGAIAAMLVFFMREVTQAEYRWIEANGGLRSAMPWWKGLDLRLWDAHSITDVLLPALSVCGVATAVLF